MPATILHNKGEYRLFMDYDKYKKQGDLHWQWYNTPGHEYRTLVNESLKPFMEAQLGVVVDIGCGDGLPLSMLDGLGFKCKGVDPDITGVKLALDHNVSAEYFVETAEKFASREYDFDYLYSLNTIEHIRDPKCMVEIMRHVGEFGVIVTDNADKNKPSERSIYHSKEFSPAEFEELFKEFNLERLPITAERYFGYKIWKK